ncbi:MAG: DUF1553 domain-containing protein [Deltaproteobacteria bacterium]
MTTTIVLLPAKSPAADTPAADHFEKRIRPLLIERCHKCHAGEKVKGNLHLDSAQGLRQGGETGAVVVPGKPDESRLIQAVRHEGGLKMPPDGKLSDTQIADLVAWVKGGAVFPDGTPAAAPTAVTPLLTAPLLPNADGLAPHLQLWLKGDDLALKEGEPVFLWPDRSGHGRDLSATKGVRVDGVGAPGLFIKESAVQRRPAVRFEPATGLAASPDNPVDIRGDAALTIVLVLNLQPHDAQPPYDGVLGIGNPANPGGDPGRPLAALVQINRGEDHALHFAGGWNHDASAGNGSFKTLYGRPIILVVTKTPGPMRTATQIFVNGERIGKTPDGALEGRDTVPDIQHRADIGAYMGKAVSWAGSFRGDVGEVVVYNRVLNDAERFGLEAHLGEKYAITLRPQIQATRASFTPEEKAFWSYQPVEDVVPPAVKDESWVVSPIDRFVLARLEAAGLKPAPAADKPALIRRATFDLTGLPPTPEEIDAFLKDESPQAFEKIVNRLLESPHYGERWGRHWLDVVRYADSTANDANAVMRYAWRYRNYVIDAFSRDLPYDQFLIEQLAGDLLPPTDDISTRLRRTIATGYLMVGPKALAETDKEQSRLDIVDDQLDVTGRAMLGLTLACARCHDHKFDAIRAADYYALAGIFRSTEPFMDEARNSSMWWEFPMFQAPGEKPFVVMAPKETMPKNLRIHLRGNRFTLGAVVPRGFLQVVAPEAPAIEAAHSGRLELARWIASPGNPLTARVMVNRVWQHHFGRGIVATSDNFGTRGERPSHPELLDYLATQFVANGWSVKKLHRLIVLSNTYREQSRPSDAARQADPENRLLSWFPQRRLSAEEVRDAVLAVSGQLDREPGTSEASEALWKEAEILDAKRGFAPNRMQADHPFYTDFRKRSVYFPVVRNMLPDVLALFDAADPNNVTAVRNDTTVPSQSLFLLNSRFVREQSQHFARRLLADEKATDEVRCDRAHRLALGRPASADEQKLAMRFLDAYLKATVAQARPEAERRLSAWQSYCQTLFCANEFLYVE